MPKKFSCDKKYGATYRTKKGAVYYFEVTTLPQVGGRKSCGIYPVGSFLIKFARPENKKFFSYEVRFTSSAIKGMNIKEDDLKGKSINFAMKILERDCDDDMLVTVEGPDRYTAVSAEYSVCKSIFWYHSAKFGSL